MRSICFLAMFAALPMFFSGKAQAQCLGYETVYESGTVWTPQVYVPTTIYRIRTVYEPVYRVPAVPVYTPVYPVYNYPTPKHLWVTPTGLQRLLTPPAPVIWYRPTPLLR